MGSPVNTSVSVIADCVWENFLSKRRRTSIWSGGKWLELDFRLVNRVKEGMSLNDVHSNMSSHFMFIIIMLCMKGNRRGGETGHSKGKRNQGKK